jgi:DNA invertase Pin-like site-specific DNA recombinase
MRTGLQPLVPKTGGELIVVAIGRISTVHQDVENIEASYRYVQEYLRRIYRGAMKITFLGEQASGMLTDRATIRRAEELVATGTVDLVIAEDLARIYRNPRHQYGFVQNAVDVGTRIICIGDNLDTADENWEITLGAAALRHGLHIPDTRRRVRRTATHSFHQGGMVQKIRYGYRKLSREEAASGDWGSKGLRIAKCPECTPVIRTMAQRVLSGQSYQRIAEWLNSEGIVPGSYVKNGRWTARLVIELLDDPILSGLRTFRDTICRPVFRTGRHKPEKNDEPETEHYPELAHLTAEEHSALREVIASRRIDRTKPHSIRRGRRGMSRRRTLWPGQGMTCGVCGSMMYYAGDHLRCSRTLARHGARCWNRVQVPVQLAQQCIVDHLVAELDRHPAWRKAMSEIVWQHEVRKSAGQDRTRRELERDIASGERQIANLTSAIAQGGQLAALVAKLKEVEGAVNKARQSLARELERSNPIADEQMRSNPEQNLHEVLLRLTCASYEFADVLRSIVPEFVIEPVQALDTPQVRPRGRFQLRLDRLASTAESQDARVSDNTEFVVNLFDPPVHIQAVPRCLAAKAEKPGLSLKQIGAQLGLNHMAVKRALDYARRMQREGLAEPYRVLSQPPALASRWRRRSSRDGQPIAIS